MPFRLQGASGETNEQVFNNERANKFTDSIIPSSGSAVNGQKFGCVNISASYGAAGQSPMVGPLTYGMLYEFTSKNDCRIVANSSYAFSATFTTASYKSYQYVPANYSKFHIPRSGSSEYVFVVNEDLSVVEASFAIVENSDG